MADGMMTLVEDGRSKAVVVVASEADARVRDAVVDLVRVIARKSGAALPVVNEQNAPSGGPQIHVGRTAYVRESGLVPDSLPMNGYRIVASLDAERLVITGSASLGTSHGVYGFLSDDLNVLWGMGDPLFEDVPERRTVTVGPTDRTERPAFGFRIFAGTDATWCRRSRLDDGNRALPYYGHSHNMHVILPPAEYRDHPEYFALIGGKRHIPEGHFGPQPCMTHPEVIRIGIEAARRFFEANPHATTFSLCPNDTKEFCQCPNCLGLDEGRPLHRRVRIASDSYYHFVEAVAREVLKSHPDRYLGTYGYWATVLPPRQIKKLPPNVVVFLTVDSSQYHDPEYERLDHDILDEWRRVADHVAIYDYYGLGWFMPRLYTGVAARAIHGLAETGVAGFYCEAWPYWAHIAPQLFLATRLLWDAKLDPAHTLDEWYRRMFREAAPQMRAYWERLERHWMTRPRPGKWFEGFDWIFEQFVHWPADVREEVWALLDEAYAAARTPLTQARVDYVRRGHRAAYLMPRACELAIRLTGGSPNIEHDIRQVGVALDEALYHYRRHAKTDVTYGNHYYVGTTYDEERNFLWWKAYLGDLIETALTGKSGLRARLIAGDPTLAELVRLRAEADEDMKTRIGWAHGEYKKA